MPDIEDDRVLIQTRIPSYLSRKLAKRVKQESTSTAAWLRQLVRRELMHPNVEDLTERVAKLEQRAIQTERKLDSWDIG